MQPLTAFAPTLQGQVFAALLAVYLFWGGTYLAMKFAIATIPPFMMGGLRFFIAGAVVYLWEWHKGTPHPEPEQWRDAIIVSSLLLVLSMGGLVWAQQFIPSGIAAIVFASVPIWMSLLAWWFFRGERPRGWVLLGLTAGFCGVLLLVKNSVDHLDGNTGEWLGYVVVTLAAVSWAWGSLYSRTATLPRSPFLAVSLQNLTGGVCHLLISLWIGEWDAFSLSSVSLPSTFSLLYLILFGSLIGFAAYLWLLQTADPTLVSTYAYVNPVVAVLLGWAMAGEQLQSSDTLAAALILCAVIILTKTQSKTA